MENVSTERMYKVVSANGYDYYEGIEKGKKFYCLVPVGSPSPNGGYYSPEYACSIKNVPNLFK
jgi:hypothetical protein